MSRSSVRSSDGEYWQYFGRFHGNGNAFPHFSIPPPPSSPPPPVPSGNPNGENADVASSASSLSEGQDYENLTKGELASIMQVRAAIRHGGVASWNGGMPIYGMGARTGHEAQNGDAVYGHSPNMNGGSYGNPIYSHGILKNRSSQGGIAPPIMNGAPPTHPVMARYQAAAPVNHDGEAGPFSKVTMSPRLMEIIERDSEVGSRQASLDMLESTNCNAFSPKAPPTDLPLTEKATPLSPKKTAASAPCTPATYIPPAPPPPPPSTFTPPTNSLRWKKMA